MSLSPGGLRPNKFVYVYFGEGDNEQKYKLVVKGSLKHLGTMKIKRYMEKATGVPVAEQQLFRDETPLKDEWDGTEIGLYDGAALTLYTSTTRASTHDEAERSSVSPSRASGGQPAASMKPERKPSLAVSVSLPMARPTSRGLLFNDSDAVAGETAWGAQDVCRTSAELRSVPVSRGTGISFDSSHSRAALASRSRSPAAQQPRTPGAAAVPVATEQDAPSDWRRLSASYDTSRHRRLSRDVGHDDMVEASYTSHPARAALPSAQALEESHSGTHSTTTRSGRSSAMEHSSLRSRASASSGTSQQRDPRISVLEVEKEAMHRENLALRDKLLALERRIANSSSDWQLRERMEEFEAALQAKDAEVNLAVKEADERARLKEDELVRELDRLRDERRRLRSEQSVAEQERAAYVSALQAQLRAAQAELRERDEMILQLRANAADSRDKSEGLSMSSTNRVRSPARISKGPQPSLQSLAQAALDRLATTFNTGDLVLDANGTCVLHVDTDDLTSNETVNVLVTLDRTAERLYMYATLLSSLPTSDRARLQLYERLLEGALLGRDTAGAGVGVSQEDDLILLSTSVDVRRSDDDALAALARPFVGAVRDWTAIAEQLCSANLADLEGETR